MKALELQTTIEHGVIKLPAKYADLNYSSATVFIFMPDLEAKETITIERLSENPIKNSGQSILQLLQAKPQGTIFTKISNPVDWQREQRDEWES